MNWTAETWTAIATVAIAAFTIILALTGFAQAWLTRKAINLAQAEFIATHRPRIRVRGASGPQRGKNGSDVFRVVVANIGENVAIIIQHRIEAYDHDGEAGYGIKLKPAPPLGEIRLISGDRHIFEAELEDEWTEDPDDPSRDGPVFVTGEIAYRDLNGVTRHTGFAREVISGGSFDFSKIYAEDEYED